MDKVQKYNSFNTILFLPHIKVAFGLEPVTLMKDFVYPHCHTNIVDKNGEKSVKSVRIGPDLPEM
jgi:hypothetical protein